LFKSKTFSFVEWLVFLLVLPIPGLNIAFVILLIYRLGLISVVKKFLIALVVYTILALGALSITGL
jgi:hypothetical protein